MGGRWKAYSIRGHMALTRKAKGQTYTKTLSTREASSARNNMDKSGWSSVNLDNGGTLSNVRVGNYSQPQRNKMSQSRANQVAAEMRRKRG